jgi:predicted lipid-binding transport protein (Tim44 family)
MEKQLTSDEVKQLQNLQNETSILVQQFGEIEFQMQTLIRTKKVLEEKFQKIKDREASLANSLTEKYGNGTIDLENKKITVLE